MAESSVPRPIPHRWLGDAFLGTAIILSGLLVAHHFTWLPLPSAAIGPGWEVDPSRYALGGVPICFACLTFLTGIAARWVMIRDEGVSNTFRWIVRLGAALSLAYLVFAVLSERYCPYSLAIQACNLAFWLIVERAHVMPIPKPAATFVAFLAGSALVASFLYLAEVELHRPVPEPARPVDAPKPNAGDSKSATTATTSAAGAQDPEAATTSGSRRLPTFGSRDAKLKLVMFYDYVSEASRRMDVKIQALISQYGSLLSLTPMHYPLCAECNFSVPATVNRHACRAARAAEAARMTSGPRGFAEMHRWLLQHNGDFTDEALRAGIAASSIEDAEAFFAAMNSEESLSAILSDTVEAAARGVTSSPAVFLNGHRLRDPEQEIVASILGVSRNTTNETSATLVTKPEERSASGLTDTTVFSATIQNAALAATVEILNEKKKRFGSGAIFAVRAPFVFVLTAEHVVASADTVQLQLFPRKDTSRKQNKHVGSVIARSDVLDLAVVRFATLKDMPTALKIVPEKSARREAGFVALAVGCEETTGPTCVTDLVAAVLRVRRLQGGAATKVWQLEGPLLQGRSGGPLVDEQGRLIGIASGTSEDRGYFCHAEEIRRFLRAHQIEGI